MSARVRLPAALLAVALTLLPALFAPAAWAQLSPGASPPATGSSDATLPDIEDEVMCPICGTALGLSEAPQADRQREFIRDLIAQGKTEDEIKDELVAEYGESVLATPDTEGFDLTAWVVPGLAIVLAGGAIAVGLARARRRPPPSDAAPLDPADAARLERDLSDF